MVSSQLGVGCFQPGERLFLHHKVGFDVSMSGVRALVMISLKWNHHCTLLRKLCLDVRRPISPKTMLRLRQTTLDSTIYA